MRFPGFVGPSYTLRSVNVDCQRCINWFPEFNETGKGKEGEVAALVPTPGLTLKVTLDGGVYRGSYTASNGQLFAVGGNKLYRVSSSWVATELGTLSTSTGKVSMADNGLHLMIVDGTAAYGWTFASSLFATIADADLTSFKQITYQDGYFIFIKASSGTFQISDLNALTFDALDVATSEGAPDNLVATISDHRDLWMFNENTTEVFFNSGAADFPFERVQGAFIEHGCMATHSVAKMNNTVLWLGKDEHGTGIVYMAKGYQPQRVSTTAVEIAMQGYGDLSGTECYAYQQDGHFFYVMNFADASTTWVYDSSTNLWHERAYNNAGVLQRHRANGHSFAHSTHVVGDYENGKLYAMSPTVYTDNGAEIVRRRRAPHLSGGMKRVFHNSFELDIETGTGLDGSVQGSDPQVMLRFSDDGGHSWSNEKWASFGKIGQRKKRVIWHRLGQSRDRVYEITVTDPVKAVILGAEIDAVPGGS